MVAKFFEKGKALIVQPTFVEYERACKHYHIEVEDVFYEQTNGFTLPMSVIREKLKEKDVIFLCRPNNPTGTVIAEKDLRLLVTEGKKTGTYVVVDEAFVDFLPASTPSLSTWLASYPNLLLLRSLTKMYTIPGLRIGYLMAHPTIINVLKNEQIPWSINSLVDAVVPKLLEDKSFVEDTKAWLRDQSEYLFEALPTMDFYLSPTQVNFYLLQDKKQPNRTEELFYFLVKHGILPRHTQNFKGLKGGVPTVCNQVKGRKSTIGSYSPKVERGIVIIFISGGARSGKSHFSEQTALSLYNQGNEENQRGTLYYIATAKTSDEEMVERIQITSAR